MMISDDSISSDDFYPAGSPVVSALYLFSGRSVSIDPSSLRYVKCMLDGQKLMILVLHIKNLGVEQY